MQVGNGKQEDVTKQYRSELRYRLAIRLAIDGDLRFISHHDALRLFERGLARAELPMVYSAGFNPRPKLSLPVPRAVGMATEDDLLVIQLSDRLAPDVVVRRLADQMPEGVRLGDVWELPPSGSVQPERVRYEVGLPTPCAISVATAVGRLLSAEQWLIHRVVKPAGKRRRSGKTVDLRAYVCEASVAGNILAWTVRVTPNGSVRPAEVLEAVGLEPDLWRHHVRRTRIEWRVQGAGHDAGATDRPAKEDPGRSHQDPAGGQEQQVRRSMLDSDAYGER